MERRKFVIGMGALTTGAAASIGTGAFTAMQADGREANINVVNDENALIGLKAGSTDLVTEKNGQLDIDFDLDDAGDGVNPNSTYQVGGLGGFNMNNLHHVPGHPTVSPNVADVAVDTETDIEGEHAFKVMNQSGSEQQIEVTYEPNDDFPDDTQVYMVAYYPQGSNVSSQEEGLAVGTSSSNAKSTSIIFADQQYSDPIGAGKEFYVTIIVNVGDYDPDKTDLGGEIIVRAGSHDEFTNADA